MYGNNSLHPLHKAAGWYVRVMLKLILSSVTVRLGNVKLRTPKMCDYNSRCI